MIKFGDKSKEQDTKAAAVAPQPAAFAVDKHDSAQPAAKEEPAASKEEPKK